MAVRCRSATRRRSSSVKMAAPLATCTKEDRRSVIHFCSEGVKPIEIHRRMKVQYGDAYLSLQQVCEWTRKFMNGISSVTDSPRPGQAHRGTPVAIAAVEAIVKENRRVTVNEIAAHLDMSRGSAHHIVHDKKIKKKNVGFSFDSPLVSILTKQPTLLGKLATDLFKKITVGYGVRRSEIHIREIWYISARPHDVRSQQTAIFIVTTM